MHKGDCGGGAGKSLKCTHLHTSSLIFLLIMKNIRKQALGKIIFQMLEGCCTPVDVFQSIC